MIRFLKSTAACLVANAIGLIVASILLPIYVFKELAGKERQS